MWEYRYLNQLNRFDPVTLAAPSAPGLSSLLAPAVFIAASVALMFALS